MVDLTVVIATYNRDQSLRNCLDSLVRQTDKHFALLIIDGGSTDKTRQVIEQFKQYLDIRFLLDKTPHLSYIRDLGWRKAKGEIVAWIDDDVVVEPLWVKGVKNAFKDKIIAGVTGPTIIPRDLLKKRDVFSCHRKLASKQKNLSIGKFFCQLYFNLFMQGERYAIGKIYPSGAWSPGSNFPSALKLKKPIKVEYLEACNFAIRKDIIAEVDGFDLSYQGTSEWCEVDLAFRIRKAGYKLIFDPKVAVEHHVSRLGVFTRRSNALVRLNNFIRFYAKTYYPKSTKGWLLFMLYLVFLLIYYSYKSSSSRN